MNSNITVSKIYGLVEVINCPKPDVNRISLVECSECPFHKDNHCTFKGLNVKQVCPFCESQEWYSDNILGCYVCINCHSQFWSPMEVII